MAFFQLILNDNGIDFMFLTDEDNSTEFFVFKKNGKKNMSLDICDFVLFVISDLIQVIVKRIFSCIFKINA